MGSTLRIFNDDLQVLDQIPVGTYKVAFNPMAGYTLEKRQDFEEAAKVYGEHEAIAERIISRYMSMERNFGTILGGRKGTGKSLTARLISTKLLALGIPTIIVDEDTDGIVDFLESIEQRVFVLFDEFEKVFDSGNDDREDRQQKFLGLLDGIINNKHLYVITINDYYKLNEYFLGRTGRFYYDFTYKDLGLEEIHAVISDHIKEDIKIDSLKTAKLLHRLNVNYDQLHSIVNELNFGESIKSVLTYLNLDIHSNVQSKMYDIEFTFANGDVIKQKHHINPLDEVAVFRMWGEVSKHGQTNHYDFNIEVQLNYDDDNKLNVRTKDIEIKHSRNEPDEEPDDFGSVYPDVMAPNFLQSIRFEEVKQVTVEERLANAYDQQG